MSWVNEDILTIAEGSGITATTSNFKVTLNKSNAPIFQVGVFGVSVFEAVTGQSWAVRIYGRVGSGARFEIAQSGGITTVTSEAIPILNAETTAQAGFMGVPRPIEVDIEGDSAGVGLTFSGIVSAALFTGD